MYIWNFLDGYKIEGISCWYKFNKMGDYIILFLVKNEVSNDIKEMNIIVEESIFGVCLKNDGFVVKGEVFNFILSVKQKGNNFCFKIDLKDSKIRYYYKIGMLFVFCDDGVIDLKLMENFIYIYYVVGDYNVILIVENCVFCVWIRNYEIKVLVVKEFCIYLRIKVEIGMSKKISMKYKWLKKIDIKIINEIKCYNVILIYYEWYIYQFLGFLGDKKKEVFSGDLEIKKFDLYIFVCWFNYSFYELIFWIDMMVEFGVFIEEKFYIEIILFEFVVIIDGGIERIVGEVVLLVLNVMKLNDFDSDFKDNFDYNFMWFCK